MATDNIRPVKLTLLVLIVTSSELTITPVCFGAKILFIPANVNSHLLFFSRLAGDLTQLGHVTRVLAPSNARVPHFVSELKSGGNFSYTVYPVDGEEPFASSREASAALMHLAVSTSLWDKISVARGLLNLISVYSESDCVRLLENDRLMQQIRDGGYQFALMDPIAVQCYYAIPYSMGISYATLSLSGFGWVYRVPRLPSFVSMHQLGDRMGFSERLSSFLIGSLLRLITLNTTTIYVDRLAPHRPSIDVSQLLQQASFLIFTETERTSCFFI